MSFAWAVTASPVSRPASHSLGATPRSARVEAAPAPFGPASSSPAEATSRRPAIMEKCCSQAISPRWLRRSTRIFTRPMRGREREERVSSTLQRAVSVSPGRTGLSHFTSSTPGAPIEEELWMRPSNMMRIMSAQVCQPEAISSPTKVPFAASSSRWKGCGSNSRAKATISSRVTRRGPHSPLAPTGKSSKNNFDIVRP